MRNSTRFITLFAGAFLLSTQAHAKTDAAARTTQLLNAFNAVKALPDDGADLSAADLASNRKAFEALDGFFSYPEFTAQCLGKHSKKFSADQRKKFDDTFTKLIRLIAYPQSGTFLAAAKTKVNAPKKKGKGVSVVLDIDVPEDDLQMETTFIWAGSSEWKIVDVLFDGDSLVKDYRNQFGRIIQKEGVDGLLKKLDKRMAKALEDPII